MIHFHNTLGNRKTPFEPLEADAVRIYSCGPTVYNYAHIGNFRAFIFADLLRRYLKFRGFRVVHVMNITDVDDKTIRDAKAKGVSLAEFTTHYADAFFKDVKTLNIESVEHYPRATEHIPEMLDLIRKLEEKGMIYEAGGSVYYSIEKFKDYGKLSGAEIERGEAFARIDHDEYERENARDFALWKRAGEDEPSWESPWGRGRPGWHIECSAMSMKYLGETFDIHTGGEDLAFPHHENEIAQSEAATGKPFVRYWLHNGYLLVEGEKMSKTKGNFHTLRDVLEKGYKPDAIRYVLLATHYRKSLNFTFDGLTAAERAIQRLRDFKGRLREPTTAGDNAETDAQIDRARAEFTAAMDDDLNISPALGTLFDFVRFLNIEMDNERCGEGNREKALSLLNDIDRVLGVIEETALEIPDEIKELVKLRDQARRDRNFAEADRIRDLIGSRGFYLEDTPKGARVKPR